MNLNLLSAASFIPRSIVFPFSWVGHIPFVDFLVQEVKPRIFVELGTHLGNSYFSFCQAVESHNLKTKCFAVDTWMGDKHAGEYENDVYLLVKNHNTENYKKFSTLLRMTFDEALNQFEDGSVDLLHIDGLHTYEAVKHDFESWLPKLSPGAVVIFHDTQVRERDFGVWKLWEELKEEYSHHLEFVHSHGLGVLQLNNAPSGFLSWLTNDFQQQQKFKHYFSSLGDRVLDHSLLLQERNRLIGQIKKIDYVLSLGKLLSFGHARILFKRCQFFISKTIKYLRFYGISNSTFIGLRFLKVYGLKNFFNAISSENLLDYQLQQSVIQDEYTEWIRKYDNPRGHVLFLHWLSNFFGKRPKFSILLDLKDPTKFYLKRLINSLLSQTYQNWELIISTDELSIEVLSLLTKGYEFSLPKIKVIQNQEYTNHASRLNKLIEASTGEWFVNVGERDSLSPDFLFRLLKSIKKNSTLGLIYTDDDVIDNSGRRHDHFFKPDWNEDFFYSKDYLGNAVCYRKKLVIEVGMYREIYQQIPNFDLILRLIENLKDDQIHHVPRVLYHCERRLKFPASLTKKCLNEHFSRMGVDAKAKFFSRVFRIEYKIPDPKPLVSLIIPTRNGLNLLRQSIDSILVKTNYPNYEIVVVNNNSDDPEILEYFRKIQRESRVKVIDDDREFNYSAINNAAVEKCNGELIGLLNNDIEVISPDWLTEMVSHAIREDVGAVGARLWYPNNTVQHAGDILVGGVAHHAFNGLRKGDVGYQERAISTQRYSSVTAACMVVRKSLYLKLGGLDEENLKVNFNDVDFCLRLGHLGYKIIWTPYAELYHHESATRGQDISPEKRKRCESEILYMRSKWSHILSKDPFYNNNLRWDRAYFSLASPPID